MATVYSLVCFGGDDGETVTMTIASPCVVTLTNHGLRDGTGVVFSTTGALPTGVTAGTTYYARWVAANTFHLYDTAVHAQDTGSTTGRVNTSGTQSGTHTVTSAYRDGLSAAQLLRYGSVGSERIYNGIQSWLTARETAGVNTYDHEICEIGDAFMEYLSSAETVNLDCYQTTIHSYVDGTRTAAFHDKVTGAGYTLRSTATYAYAFTASGYRITLDGISIQAASGTDNKCLAVSGRWCTIQNCIFWGDGSTYNQSGVYCSGVANTFINNISHSFDNYGFRFTNYTSDLVECYNNLAVKCGSGFEGGTAETGGFYYNNISVGNTTNWDNEPATIEGGGYNFGESGDSPWNTDSPTTAVTTMTTSDFADYTNNDFTPASSSADQVDAGLNVFGGYAYDMGDDVRPSYVDGTDTWDAGPIEFDHGNGLAPVDVTVTLENVVDGSRYRVYDTVNEEVLGSGVQSGTGDIVITGVEWTANVLLQIDVRKATSSPIYKPFLTNATLTNTGASVYVSQESDE